MEIAYNFLKSILNLNVLYQFIGALISIALTVMVVFLKQYNLRKQRRSYYEGMSSYQELGDIDVKVDEDLPYENVLKIVFKWSLQPLLLVFLLGFIGNTTEYIKLIVFIIVLISTMVHEFMASDEYIDMKTYRVFILILWLISYFILSYEANLI
ncbi:MAG: hypothetical protein FD170_138 [Bacteroidetes bacterium]|nr:MAG: hypothetical protein FD170_138 [Bacteroidota bacterium]